MFHFDLQNLEVVSQADAYFEGFFFFFESSSLDCISPLGVETQLTQNFRALGLLQAVISSPLPPPTTQHVHTHTHAHSHKYLLSSPP